MSLLQVSFTVSLHCLYCSPVVDGKDVVLDTADTNGAGGEVAEGVKKAAEGTTAESRYKFQLIVILSVFDL